MARLKHRVTIQAIARVEDLQGGYTESWVDGETIHASIEPAKGWEKFQAQQTQTPVTHKITARYRADITTAVRLKFGSRIFAVKEVRNVNEDNRFLKIQAVEQA